jgi:hypothetical protein
MFTNVLPGEVTVTLIITKSRISYPRSWYVLFPLQNFLPVLSTRPKIANTNHCARWRETKPVATASGQLEQTGLNTKTLLREKCFTVHKLLLPHSDFKLKVYSLPADKLVVYSVKLIYALTYQVGRVVQKYSDWLRAGRSGDRIPVGARFVAHVQTGPGAHPHSCRMGTGSFPGVKRLGRGADHPSPSSAEVKNGKSIPLSTLKASSGL